MKEILISLAENYPSIWLIMHLFAMVLGLGGATCTDILLVHFLKDLKIDKKEKEIVRILSKVVTIGVILAIISGIMLFLANPDELLQKSKFIAKVVIFVILMINGALLHHLLLPQLLKFDFRKNHYVIKKCVSIRHLGVVLGTISAVSWYSIFILGALSGTSLSVFEILWIYGSILLGSIAIGLLLEHRIKKCC